MTLPSRRTAGAIGAASAAVLVLSLFLDWYRLDLPSRVGGRAIHVPTYNAFEGLDRSDVYLVVAAAVAFLFAAMLLARVLADSPAPALLVLTAGLFALAVVIYRGTSRPARPFFGPTVGTTLRFGWVIALVAAGAIALAGLLAYLAGPRLKLELEEDEETEPSGRGGAAPAGEETRAGEEMSDRRREP